MRILVAPDSFKGTLSAAEAAEAIARGIGDARPDAEVDRCPIADGGEGTVDALVDATGGSFKQAEVCGPLGEPVTARWGLLGPAGGSSGGPEGPAAVIEMAQAAGLTLVPTEHRDPMRSTTFGVGQLVIAALDAGCAQIILGIGGSATCEGGIGALQALGARFRGPNGSAIAAPAAAEALGDVARVDRSGVDPRLHRVNLRIACDVTNPLTGAGGASAVYGPQKGATPEQVRKLDDDLRHFATAIGGDPDQPGAGAAGGLGFGLVTLAGARLERGIELIMDALGFDRRLHRADLLVTGEGRFDAQSRAGKTCLGLARRASAHGVPTVALVGRKVDGADAASEAGLAACHAVVGEVATAERAMADPAGTLQRLAKSVAGGELPQRSRR